MNGPDEPQLENLADVRLFVRIMEAGGLTAAGRVLHLPANQVSRQLTRLEASLGVRLFHRTTRKVSPTPEGNAFYEHALRILEGVQRAEEAVSRTQGLAGTVRIAIKTTSLEFGFVSAWAKHLIAHPHIHTQLLVSDEPIDLIAQSIDVSVQVGTLADSSHVVRHIGDAHYVLAASPHYVRRCGQPQTPEELIHHQVLRRLGSQPETLWTLVGPKQRQVTVPIGGRFECSDSRAQEMALREGLGIAMRPVCEVRSAANGLVHVLPNWRVPPIRVWALSPAGRARLARVNLVVDALRRVVKALE